MLAQPTPQTDDPDARLDQLLASTHQAVGEAVQARLDAEASDLDQEQS